MSLHKRSRQGNREPRMGSEHKTWPARMVAAVMTLALVLASTFAVCEHAAGHPHAASSAWHDGLALAPDAGHDATVHEHAAYGDHADHQDGATDGSGCGTGSCNCLCAGGCALLVAAAVMEHSPSAAPATGLAVLTDSAEPGGLERPPKLSLPA